jgi:hypothetical protein
MEAKIPTVNLILHPQKLKPNNSQGWDEKACRRNESKAKDNSTVIIEERFRIFYWAKKCIWLNPEIKILACEMAFDTNNVWQKWASWG